MDIAGSVVLVTGANRGLGRAFTQLLLERGATKVYGGARDPDTIAVPGRDAGPARHHLGGRRRPRPPSPAPT